jgi:hypothetical protein
VPTPSRLVPAGETDDGPGQVPDFAETIRHLQLRAQRRIFAGFPLNRPRQKGLWAAPWSAAVLMTCRRGVKLSQLALLSPT